MIKHFYLHAFKINYLFYNIQILYKILFIHLFHLQEKLFIMSWFNGEDFPLINPRENICFVIKLVQIIFISFIDLILKMILFTMFIAKVQLILVAWNHHLLFLYFQLLQICLINNSYFLPLKK